MSDKIIEVDARGLTCPLPILRLKKAIQTAATGQQVRLLSTDAGALKDVDSFCRQTGHVLLSSSEDGGAYCFAVKVC
jgi:tRNA 2-thiouridine synthesizing protein A